MGRAKEYLVMNRHFGDLNPIVQGSEACASGHSFGPFIRNYTLLHYVESGTGTYTVGGETYRVSAGEIFRILPGETTVYTADKDDPWQYCWIGFDGALSDRFATLPPVFTAPKEALGVFLFKKGDAQAPEFYLASQLFLLYAALFMSGSGRNMHYVRRVKDYVHATYMNELRVERIAEQMSLDRHYLTRMFKEKTGKSIQEYIVSVRMEEAERCLLRGCSVAETARLCGYEDACNFSKMFKARTGLSPAHFAKERRALENEGEKA